MTTERNSTETEERVEAEQADVESSSPDTAHPERASEEAKGESAETAGPEAAEPAGETPPAPKATAESAKAREGMGWYVLRVASNKEDQVREALERKVAIEGLEDRIGRIVVPTQIEKRMRAGVARIYQRKLYPGYVFVEMQTEEDGSIPEHVWFLVKETTGVGDFIGSGGKPSPMSGHDAEKMLLAAERSAEDQPGLGIPFKKGDRVKIREGSFESFEGDVENVDESKGIVTVLLTIFGRATPVDVEYWQLEKP